MATSWVTTPGIKAFFAAFNEAFPNRDRKSDGTIGDLAHQLESASSHNPDLTGNAEWKDGDSKNEVRAGDIDSDLNDPFITMEDVVQHLVMLGRAGKLAKWIRYIIYNRRIWKASDGWVTHAYTGASAHTEHLHATGAFSQTADENTNSDVFEFEDFMGLSSSDKDWLLANIRKADIGDGRSLGGSVNALVDDSGQQSDGSATSTIGRLALGQGIPQGDGAPGATKWPAWKVISDTRRIAVDAKAAAASADAKLDLVLAHLGITPAPATTPGKK